MCERLRALIEEDLFPFLEDAETAYGSLGQTGRLQDLERLRETLREMLEEIEKGEMDEWECGELYEEFVRHRNSGDFLDKII